MIQQFFDKQSFVFYTQPCDDAVRIEKLYFTVLIFFVCEILLVFYQYAKVQKRDLTYNRCIWKLFAIIFTGFGFVSGSHWWKDDVILFFLPLSFCCIDLSKGASMDTNKYSVQFKVHKGIF